MTDLADDDDVLARLGRSLTADETGAVAGLLTEASALVVGHLGRDWAALADVPAAVRVVCSRMVARALTGASNLPAGTDSFGSTFGPMAHTVRLGADVTVGQPWLSKSDRITLAPFVVRRRVVHVPMYDVTE